MSRPSRASDREGWLNYVREYSREYRRCVKMYGKGSDKMRDHMKRWREDRVKKNNTASVCCLCGAPIDGLSSIMCSSCMGFVSTPYEPKSSDSDYDPEDAVVKRVSKRIYSRTPEERAERRRETKRAWQRNMSAESREKMNARKRRWYQRKKARSQVEVHVVGEFTITMAPTMDKSLVQKQYKYPWDAPVFSDTEDE